jgi:hypothetical protein
MLWNNLSFFHNIALYVCLGNKLSMSMSMSCGVFHRYHTAKTLSIHIHSLNSPWVKALQVWTIYGCLRGFDELEISVPTPSAERKAKNFNFTNPPSCIKPNFVRQSLIPDLPWPGEVHALVSCGGAVPGARPTPYRRPAPRFVDAAASRFVDAAAPRFVNSTTPTILKYIMKNWCELVTHKRLFILKNTEELVAVPLYTNKIQSLFFKILYHSSITLFYTGMRIHSWEFPAIFISYFLADPSSDSEPSSSLPGLKSLLEARFFLHRSIITFCTVPDLDPDP